MAIRIELELKCPRCGARATTYWKKDEPGAFRPVDLFPGFYERVVTRDRDGTELACFLCEEAVGWPAVPL